MPNQWTDQGEWNYEGLKVGEVKPEKGLMWSEGECAIGECGQKFKSQSYERSMAMQNMRAAYRNHLKRKHPDIADRRGILVG